MADSAPNSTDTDESGSLLGRLLVVPLIIVGVILTCAVIVVLAFGAIASDKERPIGQVLSLLEAGTGQRTAGLLLMPQDKEMWQAAQELALRLKNAESEIDPDQLPQIQERLTALLRRDLESTSQLEPIDRQRLFFVMQAAVRSGAPQALPVLIDALDNDNSDIRREALKALTLMEHPEPAAKYLLRIASMLQDPEPVVRMMACLTLSKLGSAENQDMMQALADAHLTDEQRDVRWNAALTLARLGSAEALPTIADMLKRSFWQEQRVQYESSSGVAVDRPMTPNRINSYLITAIEAAMNLDDGVTWGLIATLADDKSPAVVTRARKAVAGRDGGSS